MSLSILNSLLEIDKQNIWLKYVYDNGYLACIINSVQANNSLLEECFHSETSDKKIIYVYETKMVSRLICAFFILHLFFFLFLLFKSLLISISKTPQGAEYLLKNNLINALASCSIFDIRTKFDR